MEDIGSCLFTYWNKSCHSTNLGMNNILTCLCVLLYLHWCVLPQLGGWSCWCWHMIDKSQCLHWRTYLFVIQHISCVSFFVGGVLQSSLWSLFLDTLPAACLWFTFYDILVADYCMETKWVICCMYFIIRMIWKQDMLSAIKDVK